ncbi:MAG: hypothetical protein KDI27_03460 [Gammaproteobacteria bacterium]|nr:hypothetical protein [Gammaproteobacteria bacterium]MCP5416466.1 hypothetical protein [Chromatiaceae bacterium]
MSQVQKNSYSELLNHLDERADIANAIEVKKVELVEASLIKQNCQHEAVQLSMEIQQRRHDIESAASVIGRSSVDATEQLEELNSALKEKQQESAEAESLVRSLNREIGELQARANFHSGTDIESVRAYQKALAAAEAETKRISSHIEEQEARIAKARDYSDPAADLHRKREEILGSIAIGEADQKALDAIDRKIADVREKAADEREQAERVISVAGDTIKGLRRRLEAATAEHERLMAIGGDVLNNYYRAEAEKEGKRYVKLAAELLESYGRLVGINMALPNERGVRFGSVHDIDIPVFSGLDAFQGFTPRVAKPGELAEAERARLRDNGIRL